jgi:hypothetical protein
LKKYTGTEFQIASQSLRQTEQDPTETEREENRIQNRDLQHVQVAREIKECYNTDTCKEYRRRIYGIGG